MILASVKWYWWAALLAASLSSTLHAQQVSGQTFDFDGQPRTLVTFVPNDAPASQSRPLLVLLHGSMGTGASMIAMWRVAAEKSGIVLVAPNALDARAWQLQSDGPRFIRAAIGLVATRHAVDASRIYLFGYSGGAVYALTLSMLESQLFAATATYAGAWASAAEFRAIGLAARKIPVVLFIGDNDVYFPLNDARRTKRALRSMGHEVDVHVLTGYGHGYTKVADTVNAEATEFFLRHRLEAAVPGSEPAPGS